MVKTKSQDNLCAQIESYWSWRSEIYDVACSKHYQWNEVFMSPFCESGPLNLLDMGTGSGFIAIGFAEKGHRVTGLDLAPEMLKLARKKANGENVSVNFMLGNAQEPPHFSELFNGITCRNLLWTLPDPLKALTAWRKLLKPMGRIVIADGMWGDRPYLKKDEPLMTRFREAYSTIKKDLPFFLGMTANDGKQLLEKAGFSCIARHDHLFHENPYENKYEFFVLSAINHLP
jgi:ubiquinone/menaquinone biosynthesis C-methylase UbiE